MKKQIVILAILMLALVLTSTSIFARNDNSTNTRPKSFNISQFHDAGSIWLRGSNYGFIGSADDATSPSLEYPGGSGVDYLYQGAIWIGGKKYRRNAAGLKLYWIAQNPTADSSAVVAEGEYGWNAGLKPVIDTLTTIGFDGDKDLYELLPAYNPLESGNEAVYNKYAIYNPQDVVLKSIYSYPSPQPYVIPDTTGIYCFSIPVDQTGNEPGFETLSAYYYDYSPFGTTGQRDWGQSRSSNMHVPLNIAVEQKSYAYPVQNYDKMIIFKFTLHNSNEADTLYDISIGSYMDCDCGQRVAKSEKSFSINDGCLKGGSSSFSDDVSGYIMGGTNEGSYEFAYSRDADGDDGITPALIGSKFILPDYNLNRSAWYWQVGSGPDDFTPLSLVLSPHKTANEKYWLMTDKDPNSVPNQMFKNLKGGPDGTVLEYEQPAPCDTRFMTSIYGNLPTIANPSPDGRININPGSDFTFYMVVMAADNMDNLKQRALDAENLVLSNFDLGNMQGLTSIPYLSSISQRYNGTVDIKWASYTEPGYFEVMYKPAEAPASQWQAHIVSGTTEDYQITGLTDGIDYKFKIASIFNPGANEVYLESVTKEFTLESIEVPATRISNYPNPFNPQTTIVYDVTKNGKVKLTVYNIKGQEVRKLVDEAKEPGRYPVVWDGRDSQGTQVASGIYFCRLSVVGKDKVHKMLMLK